jgi:hypothetical protein
MYLGGMESMPGICTNTCMKRKDLNGFAQTVQTYGLKKLIMGGKISQKHTSSLV